MNIKFTVVTLLLAIAFAGVAACGTDEDLLWSDQQQVASGGEVADSDNYMTRSQAIEIVRDRYGWGTVVDGESDPIDEPGRIVTRIMGLEEFEQIHGIGASKTGGVGYGSTGPVWVVQVRVDSENAALPRGDAGGNTEFRYAIWAIHVVNGSNVAEQFNRAEPLFISAEITNEEMNDLKFVEQAIIPTNISRDEALRIIKADHAGGRNDLLDRVEIDLVATADGGVVWWVYVPEELGAGKCFGGPDSERHLWCMDAAAWWFVDSSTGEVEFIESARTRVYFLKSREAQSLQRFAWAEGWWELWHRLKPYDGRELPIGFAESLDRPNSPTPTSGPPMPTPDPNELPRPTPTPAPTETAAQRASRTLGAKATAAPRATVAPATRPTSTPIPTETVENLKALRSNPDWMPESPSTSLDKSFYIGMAIRNSEDMQIRFDAWSDEHKILVEPGLAVIFTYDVGAVSWIGPVIVNHIPSFSSVHLDWTYELDDRKNINSPEAEEAISNLLANEELMAEIIKRAHSFWQ
jgi:hypothetical protein